MFWHFSHLRRITRRMSCELDMLERPTRMQPIQIAELYCEYLADPLKDNDAVSGKYTFKLRVMGLPDAAAVTEVIAAEFSGVGIEDLMPTGVGKETTSE